MLGNSKTRENCKRTCIRWHYVYSSLVLEFPIVIVCLLRHRLIIIVWQPLEHILASSSKTVDDRGKLFRGYMSGYAQITLRCHRNNAVVNNDFCWSASLYVPERPSDRLNCPINPPIVVHVVFSRTLWHTAGQIQGFSSANSAVYVANGLKTTWQFAVKVSAALSFSLSFLQVIIWQKMEFIISLLGCEYLLYQACHWDHLNCY